MDKKRNNEYGFTLVELLVAIAIILSITVLAIVNIAGVSNRKKEEAWVSVKEEIETAATDYFKYNEYLFEGLGDNGTGTISVGKLVGSDYLNKVTDPRTGQSVSYCTKVNVTKIGRNVKVNSVIESNDSSINCDSSDTVLVSNSPNSPKLSESLDCEHGTDEWCKKGKNPVHTVYAEAINSPVKDIEIVSKEGFTCGTTTDTTNGKKRNCTLNKESSGSTITYRALSEDGSISILSSKVKWDNTPPGGTITITSTNGNFNDRYVNIVSNVVENGSGVAKFDSNPQLSKSRKNVYELKKHNLFDEYNGTSKKLSATVTDGAGNVGTINSNNYKVYQKCSSKTKLDTIVDESKCSEKCGGGKKTIKTTYVYKDTYINQNCTSEETSKTLICNLNSCENKCPNILLSNSPTIGNWEELGDDYYIWYLSDATYKHDGDSSYWTWYNNGVKQSTSSTYTVSSNGKNTLTIKGKNGESCEEFDVYINKSAPSCPSIKVLSGTLGNNGWYRSNIKLGFDVPSGVQKWTWNVTHNDSYSSGYENSDTLTLSNEGYTSVGLTVYNSAGAYRICNLNEYKIDKTSPKLSEITYDKNIKQFNSNGIILSGKLNGFVMCLKNDPNASTTVPGATAKYTDNASGISNSNVYSTSEFDSVDAFNRWCTPSYYGFSFYAIDNAGNKSEVSYSKKFKVSYILKKSSANYDPDCYLYSYTNRFETSGFYDNGVDYNTDVKYKACTN